MKPIQPNFFPVWLQVKRPDCTRCYSHLWCRATQPDEYYLFRNLKSHLCGCRSEEDKLIEATGAYCDQRAEDFYKTGITTLKDSWSKCIEISEDFTAKQNKSCLSAFLFHTLFAYFDCPQYAENFLRLITHTAPSSYPLVTSFLYFCTHSFS